MPPKRRNSTDAPRDTTPARAPRSDETPRPRPYTPPRLNTYGTLGAITGTSKPKGRTDKTSRRTGY